MVNVGYYILKFLREITILIYTYILEFGSKITLNQIGNNLNPKAITLVKYCDKIVNGELKEEDKISCYEEIIEAARSGIKGLSREGAAKIILCIEI